MADYISLEAAKQRIRDSFPDLAHRCEINAILNSIPAADVRPVVRARWIDLDDDCLCSACGAPWNYCDNCTEKFNFCPNCGADMREVKADG